MIPLDIVEQMPLHLFSSGVPVISQLGSPRGHNGSMINSILCTYAAMNEHDAFITPTRSIKDFYAQHVLDTDCFHVIPNGVDSDLFRPMDKAQARAQAAEMLNRPEIKNKKIVGFFGRFQPEKGAGIFIKIAAMLPDVLFLVVAPTLHAYQPRSRFKTSFVPSYDFLGNQLQCKSILKNVTQQHNQQPLMHTSYHQDWKAVLALTLLDHHTFHEVEAVLMHIVKDRRVVTDILKRVRGFIQATSL